MLALITLPRVLAKKKVNSLAFVKKEVKQSFMVQNCPMLERETELPLIVH
jgi:hypothetical protein